MNDTSAPLGVDVVWSGKEGKKGKGKRKKGQKGKGLKGKQSWPKDGKKGKGKMSGRQQERRERGLQGPATTVGNESLRTRVFVQGSSAC